MTRNGRTRHGSGPHHRQRAGRGSRRRHTSLLGGSLPALHPNIHTLLPPLVFLLRSYRYQHPRHLDYPCFLSSDNVTIHELYPGVQVGLGSIFVLRLPVQVTSSPIFPFCSIQFPALFFGQLCHPCPSAPSPSSLNIALFYSGVKALLSADKRATTNMSHLIAALRVHRAK
jgi:hypothetical protein